MMAGPRIRSAYAWAIACLAFAPVGTAAQDAPVLVDGWKIDFDTDRCYMARATGDGLQGIEFQLLEDDTTRMLFLRRGWPLRTGSTPASVTIAGERITQTAKLSQSDGETAVSFEITESLIDGLAAGTMIGLDIPELGISASFDVGAIAAARQKLYDCAMAMLW